MVIPLFSIITPLLALPVITSRFGADAWAAVAVSTAVGAILGAVVELGWSWNGPMRVARNSTDNRRRQIAWAFSSRVTLFVPAAAIGAAVAALLSPAYALEASLVAIATTALSLSMAWVFVGLGRPWLAVLTDALPKLVGVTLAALAMHLLSAPLWIFPVVGLLPPTLIAPLITARVSGLRRTDFAGQSWNRIRIVIHAQSRVTTARFISNGYLQLPVVLVLALTSVSEVAIYAAGDRLARMTLSGLSPLPSMFQRWVGSTHNRRARMDRARTAVWINIGIGLSASIVFVLAMPWLLDIVFSGTVRVDPNSSYVLGAMITTVTASRAVGGIALVAAGRQAGLLGSTVAGAIVGIPSIITLTILFGAFGAFIGVLISEVAVLVVQLIAINRPHGNSTAKI